MRREARKTKIEEDLAMGRFPRCLISILYFMFFSFGAYAPGLVNAQGIEMPPITSFKPDSSLPEVNVPEFVITGKAKIELPKPEKQLVEIDSSYFRSKELKEIGIDLPKITLSNQDLRQSSTSNLFARLSMGSYTTLNYLAAGGSNISGYNLHLGLAGNYTSGFEPYTIGRQLSIHASAEKDFQLEQYSKTVNVLDINYTRGSYFLYGNYAPADSLLRVNYNFDTQVSSDLEVGGLPVSAALSFNRFSMHDTKTEVQSSIELRGKTLIALESGSITPDGSFSFGYHTIGHQKPSGLTADTLNKPFYNLVFGAYYNNSVGNFTYLLGAHYFQYSDDSSSGVAKFYPDLGGNYKVNDRLSLFARFGGAIMPADLSNIVHLGKYVDGAIPILNRQTYAEFVLGGKILATNDITVVPQVSYEAARYFPFFASAPSNDISLYYASKAKIFKVSLRSEYVKDRFSADIMLSMRSAKADSLGSIPNLSPFDMTAEVSYHMTKEFEVKESFLFFSGRYSDLALKSKLNGFALINLHLSYDVNGGLIPFEVFADINNLLNQKYYIWQGYREFPVVLSIGVSGKFL
jgi:hypothetical protein